MAGLLPRQAASYDEARRAITYLRRHESDADDIAPSLYALYAGRSRSENDDAPVRPEVTSG